MLWATRAVKPTATGISDRMRFFDAEQLAALPEVAKKVDADIDGILERFYRVVADDPALSPILAGSAGWKHLAAAQKGHWKNPLSGRIDDALRERGKRIGAAHVRVDRKSTRLNSSH